MRKTKLWHILWIILISGCRSLQVPQGFEYKEIQTRDFTLASWQKLDSPDKPVKIYLEGDGYAFNSRGKPTKDPTPKGDLVRRMAFSDESENVVYLARPCQYVMSPNCSQRHWTTARFAPEVIISEAEAIGAVAGEREIILTGFSGGAQTAGLAAVIRPNLKIKKLMTVAGNLDHLAWTQYHDLPPLNESMALESYRQQYLTIPQIHYAGEDDTNIPPFLIEEFTGGKNVVIVPGATHNSGWEQIFPLLHEER